MILNRLSMNKAIRIIKPYMTYFPDKSPQCVLIFLCRYFFCLLIALCTPDKLSAEIVIKGASGIVRQHNHLMIVSDVDSGGYYKYALSSHLLNSDHLIDRPIILKSGSDGVLERVELPHGLRRLDLESIDLLADGQVVVLSERLRSLLAKRGFIVEYDNSAHQYTNRGTEGLAVRGLENYASQVAVLWEGGYPDYRDLSLLLRNRPEKLSANPVIWTHLIEKDETGLRFDRGSRTKTEIELKVPELPGREPEAQRFRAPDLVWHKLNKDEWGFIVLLSSGNAPRNRNVSFHYHWLLRFNMQGHPIGDPLDIEKQTSKPHLKRANWEGLGWFEQGRSLILVHDMPYKGPPNAIVIKLPPEWKAAE